ncbi:hypothetical protein [Frigidibacter mobilis]|uniref:Uncharacterized protein n=1 Tax=Frigidibacter mobilis TaxID=1335048 RepID=A0A165SPM9_9RHOB|nr:hypothetical protein [Frigidibacter mobilis]AMY69933.1 hypothetical protein AKL17_2694 [Frigidibacter mobilis]
MTDITPAPVARRWYFNIPIFGWIARDLSRDFEGNIWFAIVMLVSLIGIAVLTWGLPALGLIAVASVPLIFVLLFFITLG